MKSFGFALITILLFSMGGVYAQNSKSSTKKDMKEDTLTWKATVVKVPFVNKRGNKVEGMADLFLRKDNKNYFIKFSGGKLSRVELERFVGQEITVDLVVKKGNWDVDESNHWQQSRVGEYVVVFRIAQE